MFKSMKPEDERFDIERPELYLNTGVQNNVICKVNS